MFPREAAIQVSGGDDQSLEFQIISWYTCDFEYSSDDSDSAGDDSEEDNGFQGHNDEDKYLAKVFGVTAEGHSVGLNILNFTPYFYIKVNHRIDKIGVEKFRQFMVSNLPSQLRKSLIGVKLMRKKDFWGFYNGDVFNYIRFTFKSLKGFRAGIRVMSKPVYIIGMHSRQTRYQLCESNIDPFLRLVHIRDIEPAGWVSVEGFEKNTHILPTKCQIDISVDWRKIKRADVEKMAPLSIASFDIECVSSHGDFPVARKDYKKVAYEFFQLYESKKNTVDELKEYLYMQLVGVFDNEFQGELSKVFVKPNEKLSKEGYVKLCQRVKAMMDDIIHIASGKVVYSTGGQFGRTNDAGKALPPSKDDILKKLTQTFGYWEEQVDERTKVKTVYWSSRLKFPQLEGDPMIQIGTTVHTYGEKECNYKHIITLGSCDPIDGVVVESCEDEKELLLKWCDLVNRLDPDVLTGYNIFGFDMSYMYDRAIELGCKNQFCKIGRLVDHVSKFEEKNLSSSALGDNILKFVDMEGRVLIDVMKVVQRDHKLDSYKLDAVATHFMGMNKNDVSPNDIFRLQKGTSADRKVVADYCVQDCALCNHLMMKLEIITNNIGMANVCNVPLAYIFMRGQGIKIFSLVSKQCKQDDFVIPTLNKGRVGEVDEDAEEDEEGYEGAIVLEPKTGIYTDDPVSVLDYASLYPSSMISENLSHDCLVERGGKYDNLPGVEYLDVSYDIYEKVNEKKTKIGERVCRFTQNEKGVIPRILQTLLRKRKETRKKIEYETVTTVNGDKLTGLYSEDGDNVVLKTIEGKVSKCLKSEVVSKENTYDDFTKAVLDGLQLAYKVTANSLYGQIGAKTSQIYLKDIAACTTATGRNMILKAKKFLEDNYVGVNIVYGDSVTGYTPTVVRVNGQIYVEKFENIAPRFGGDVWLPCTEQGKQTKEACELSGLEVWTDDGWTVVKRIIRHQLASHKRIIRVATHTGVVDVTDEHSLLRKDLSKVTPQESKVGDELLHNDLPQLVETCTNISVEEARIMGMFCGDGSCGSYDCPSGKKSSWAINNSDYSLLTYYQSLCEKVYPDYEWKILDTIGSSGVYKLVAKGNSYGSIVKLVSMYRQMLYCDKEKIVPQDILCAPKEVKQSFWNGLYDADGIKKNETGTRIDQKNQVSAATFALLGNALGYKVSINTRTDKPNIFRLTLTKGKQRRNSDAIKKMYPIEYQGYVYDFTTDNHRFQSGIGRLIVSNTDSVFVAFPMEYTDENGVVRKRTGEEAVQHAINMGIEASSKFKKYLKPPHDLEYEKTFFPFILISKKRYCALKYEHDPKKCKFNSMGIALKRRDNAPIVKTVYGGVIDIIMQKQDVGESINFLKKSIEELIDGKHPLESLIISKSLRADYKDPTRIAHKALAERMGERDPGNKPQVNDRIPYVYVDISEKAKKAKANKEKILQGDRIEHPDYIRKAGLKPDYEFYITNQIMKPVSQIYALVLEKMPGYRKGADYFAQQEKKLIVEKGGDMKKVKDKIADMREAEVEDILFKPFLTKLQNKRDKNREITDWFKKMEI